MSDTTRTHSTDWCFTINNLPYLGTNPISQDPECYEHPKWNASKMAYMKYSLERGSGGTIHWQGFLVFKRSQRLSYAKKCLPRAHFEMRKGTREQADNYCDKDDTRLKGPYVNGACKIQGQRTDLQAMKELIDNGASEIVVAEANFSCWANNYKAFNRYAMLKRKRQCFEKQVIWLFGETGTGKSRKAYEMAPDAFWKQPGTKWWDGYDGEEDIILDDFRIEHFKISTLLRLFDRYPLSVECKGSSVPFLAKRIIITAPVRPQQMWKQNEYDPSREGKLAQLFRRITLIEEVSV